MIKKLLYLAMCVSILSGCTSLHDAIRDGNVEQVRQIANSKNINIKDDAGVTPLYSAVTNGDAEIVNVLIQKGADVSIQDNGDTLLHVASKYSYRAPNKESSVEIIHVLIEHGINVNAQDATGLTPLHLAAYNGDVEIARVLIEHGADTQIVDRNGYTPLLQSVLQNHPAVVRLLTTDEQLSPSFFTEIWQTILLTNPKAKERKKCLDTLIDAFSDKEEFCTFITTNFIRIILVGRIDNVTFPTMVNIERKDDENDSLLAVSYKRAIGIVRFYTGRETTSSEDTEIMGFQLPLDEKGYFYASDLVYIGNSKKSSDNYTLHSISSLIDTDTQSYSYTTEIPYQHEGWTFEVNSGRKNDPFSAPFPERKFIKKQYRTTTSTTTTYSINSVQMPYTKTLIRDEKIPEIVKIFFHPISLAKKEENTLERKDVKEINWEELDRNANKAQEEYEEFLNSFGYLEGDICSFFNHNYTTK